MRTQSPNQSDITENARVAVAIADFLVTTFSFSVSVFLRRRFGMRYMGPEKLVLATLFLLFLTGTNALIGQFGSEPSAAMALYTLLFIPVSLYHLIAAIVRFVRGELWHSECPGISWPIWDRLPLPAYVVQIIIEPILCLVACATLWWFSQPLAVFLLWGAACLAGTGIIRLRIDLKAILDAQDAQIEAEYRDRALSVNKPSEEAKGLTVLAPVPRDEQSQLNLSHAIGNLDPALQTMILGDKLDRLMKREDAAKSGDSDRL